MSIFNGDLSGIPHNSVFDLVGAPLQMLGVDPSDIPFVGGLFTSPEGEAAERAYKNMQRTYQQYRPMAAQGRMNALGNQLDLFGPVNDQLGAMYGKQFDLGVLRRNPMPAGMVPGLQTGYGPPPSAAPQQMTPDMLASAFPETSSIGRKFGFGR